MSAGTPGEAARRWLAERVPFTVGPPEGVTLDRPEARLQPEAIVRTMAQLARTLHSLDVADCPFDARVDVLLAESRRRLAAGAVDPTAFGEPYRRYSPDALLELTVAARPSTTDAPDDLVVTHGALVPNAVVVAGGEIVSVGEPPGAAGLGGIGLGVGDRYRDLAVTAAALAGVVGPGAVGPFFDEYGLGRPDPRKVDFFVMLSQFS